MSEGLSRRSFLKLAATASAAAAIPGCEPAARKLIPYVVPDEYVTPGVPSFYATTCTECGAGCGIVARIREGRVIKLEGNPNDPISGGAICARGQAALQGLYNPDRLSKPNQRGDGGTLTQISWDAASKQLNAQLSAAAKNGKNRVVYVGAPQGPTIDKITRLWLQAWGSTRAIFWEAIGNEPARKAGEICFGRRDLPVYKLDQAETIISFGADFLETWRSPVEFGRQYAEFRAPKQKNGSLTVGRAAYVGPRLNATAAKSDEWLAANPGGEGAVAMAVLNVVVSQGWIKPNSGIDAATLKSFIAGYDPDTVAAQTGVSADQIKRIAQWFGQADGAVALADTDDVQGHVAAYVLNAVTGNLGKTVVFLENEPPQATTAREEIQATIDSMRNGEVDVLVIGGGANPAYSMPVAYGFKEAARRVKFVAWMGDTPDDSSEGANLLLPTHHPLESWRDTAPRAGINGLGQPVMQPVFASKPLADILLESAHLGAGAPSTAIPWESAADAVNAAWQDLQNKIDPNATFQDFWDKARANGGAYQEAKPLTAALSAAAFSQRFSPPPPITGLTLVAYPHIFLYDGRGANKSWLQEIPDPVNQIVWDSWADIHPDTAKSLGFSKDYLQTFLYAGNHLVEIDTPTGPLQLGVHITSLVKPGVIAVPLGQGHTSYGRYAKGRGVNLWAHLPQNARSIAVTAHRVERAHQLVTPLGSSDMMKRSIIEAMSVDDLVKGVEPPAEGPKVPEPFEMYEPFKYPGHKWGMTIDVNSCNGCSACVAACYAENNLPVVGKQYVSEGRVMSWLRIERFIPEAARADEGAPFLYIAPIMCQQCDHAPCEPVCPVFASHHTPEGLNAQIYNRCIGTRFCENNCPYKVRRFNWFLPEWPAPLNLQLNPDVTTRGAGVMEKCSFCIQRITSVEIDARVEGRAVMDGEIVPACAQACPARAITFGDINDANSAMMRRRSDNKLRNYTMLPEFNALPNVTYLRALYRDKGRA